MGNCLFGGLGAPEAAIKVVTSNGGIMEFYPPITAECITSEFPGHGVFRSHDLFWNPLPHNEELLPGDSYYLLPLKNMAWAASETSNGQLAQVGHVRSKSIPTTLVTSYRMSFDNQGALRRSHTDVFSRYTNIGVWKVKLVISPQHLLDILSQEAQTQELIESVRTVAKCGNGVSSIGFSDQWSLANSRNASSKKDALLEI